MIPLAKDTREAIGPFAEGVENRSLLFQKMVLAKNWGHEARFNDANRFNVLRASSGGGILLKEDRDSAAAKARGGGKNAADAKYKAKVAGAMANVKVDNDNLAKCQVESSLHLLSLLEKSYPGRSNTFVSTLGGRLLINIAGGVQENSGMALDRCCGLPFIPGSAVKGVTRNTALWDIRNTTNLAEKRRKLRLALFAFGYIGDDIRKRGRKTGDYVWAAGDEITIKEAAKELAEYDSFKGLLSFLPAHPTEKPEIIAEVLTPHPRAAEAARGVGEPRPIFFPAVKEGSTFGFAIIASRSPEAAPVEEVLKQAGEWLRNAIMKQGIGAKTGAGYGWFIIDPQAEEKRRIALMEMERKAEQERIQALADTAAAEAIAKAQADPMLMARLKSLPIDELRARLNKFEFADHRFWPTSGDESDPVFQLSLLKLLLTDDSLRAELGSKAKGAKALKQLAAKFHHPPP